MSSSSGQPNETRRMLAETFSRFEEERPEAARGALLVEKPEARIYPTGIPGFDSLLDGGIPSRSLLLLIGEVGAHHRTFLHQLLYNHILDGGKVAYYPVEFTPAEVQEDMSVFGWELKSHLTSGAWSFISVLTPELQTLAAVSPSFQSILKVELARTLNPLKTDVLSKIKEGRWTAVELSYLLRTFGLKEVVDFTLYWKRAIVAFGGVHFAMLPMGVHSEEEVNTLRYLADGVLEFSLREGVRELEGSIVIRKMRKTYQRGKIIPFMVSETGIAVETAERIA